MSTSSGSGPVVDTTADTRVGSPMLMLTVATVGFAINFWAWALLSPLGPVYRDSGRLGDISESDVALLVAVPVIVGSLGRIPVGALTDKFGARVMFPLVSAATIVPVLYIGLLGQDSYSSLLVAGFFLGIGGTAFAVGVPFVSAWFPPERRGFAVGVFGAGMVGTAISALTTVKLYENVGDAAPFVLTASALAVFAVVAWLVLRDAPGRVAPTGTLVSRIVANARLPITWQACILYAVAFGGYVAFSVYLPAYLQNAWDLEPADAANRMAGFVVVAVVMRPVGGWLSDRLGPIPVLAAGYAVVTVGAAVAAETRILEPVGAIAFLVDGRRPRFGQRCHVRPDRQGHRALSRRWRHGSGRRRGRPRGLRPAAADGLHLRPHRLLRHRPVAARDHRRADPAADRHRRTPHPRSRCVTTDAPGLDTPLVDALVRTRRYFTKGEVSADLRTLTKQGGREADDFYRDRWSHDKVVRSTHGVNCTGSCSWKVYVKDGIITWETQQTDYPSAGPDRPDYEPRGCPRGAAFSWYTYSPTRIRYPYIRGTLLQMYREAKRQHDGDPVKAWAHVVDHPLRAKAYKSARGKGGLVRASWDEATEMVAAAYVHTIQKWGPDRVAGFSPIPAMSMVSHASGARFTHLVGGSMLSFYDWYADLPVASPQVFGDQTDVPESGDWWDAGYLVMWGSNVPVTRTPDAHWMTEARYRGQKVVVVAPDYADNVKFADEWLPARPGTDAALALAMGHVILKEFFVDRTTPYFDDYVKRYTDLPMLVRIEDGRPGKMLTAEDLPEHANEENAAFKTVLIDARTEQPVVPNGALGHRFGDAGVGRWNLDLQGVEPRLALEGDESAEVTLPLFGDVDGSPGETTASVPVRRVGDHLVTTVYELMLARYATYTPEWQEPITGVPASAAARIAREFARNAEESRGRSMILMGAGTNHWFHSDTIYRSFLALTTLTGCQGVNGGGWAHYVGQEKVRPVTGHAHLANALDWSRPPRNMIQAAYWYLHTDQFRYDHFSADTLSAATSTGQLAGLSSADVLNKSARMGWMPSYPTFDRNPLELCDEAAAAGRPVGEHVVAGLRDGSLRFAGENPDAPENFPRVLAVWRANLLGLLGQGQRVLPQAPARDHLVGAGHRDGGGPEAA